MTDGQNVGAINVKMGLDGSQFKAALGIAQGQTNAFAGMAKMALGGIAAGFSMGAVINELNKSYKAAEEAITIEKQLNATLLATGFACNITSDQLINLASDMQDLTGANDEVIKSAENILLTFRNINSDIFPETLQLSQDMAVTMGQDLNSAILQVGKSLNDPIKGMTALSRMGVSFTQDQKDQIKTLVKSGQAHQAQKIILQELSSEFGGAAKASKTYTQQITNDMDDLHEEIGRLVGLDNPLTKFTANMVKGFKDWAYSVRITSDEIKNLKLTELSDRLQKVYDKQNTFNKVYENAITGKKQIAERNKEYDNEAKAIVKQIGLIRERDKANKATGDKTRSELSFNTGKETTSAKKDNPALDEYKSFIDEFKQATIEYEATLKAKRYVEDTLGMSAIQVDKTEYDNAIAVYKDYYTKIAEISQSEAINKGILLKKAEDKLQQDLQTSALGHTQELLIKQNEMIRAYQEQEQSINNQNQAEADLGGFKGSFQAQYQQKLDIIKWYYDEKDKITNTANLNAQQKQEIYGQLETLKTIKLAETQKGIFKQRGADLSNILTGSFDTMLTGYGGFSTSMKQMALNLGRYLIQQTLQTAIQQIQIEQMKAAVMAALGVVSGPVGVAFGAVTSIFNGKKNHSGGTIVNSANSTLPGTQEQLRILKGGERVLNPSETASYNSGNNGSGSTVIVYSPQVKAMDSKDVSNWFNENKQQIIGIVSQGIKNNNGGIRNIVQSV